MDMDFKLVGNWKMHPKTKEEALKLIKKIKKEMIPIVGYEVGVCPPFVFIPSVYEEIKLTSIKLGAQNIHTRLCGEFTGEVSASMVEGFCDWTIVGHSERREHFKEDNEQVNEKVLTALDSGLKPIICIGETLEDYRKGKSDLVAQRLMECLKKVGRDQIEEVIVAYEPIWAIGTKNPADAQYANQIISLIRQAIAASYNRKLAYKVPLLYGGSTNGENIESFASQPEINGVLAGGASIKSEEFVKMGKIIKRTNSKS